MFPRLVLPPSHLCAVPVSHPRQSSSYYFSLELTHALPDILNYSLVLRNNNHEIMVKRGQLCFSITNQNKYLMRKLKKKTTRYHLVPIMRKALNKLRLKDVLRSNRPVIKLRRDSPCGRLSQMRRN